MCKTNLERRHFEAIADIIREFEMINDTTMRPRAGRFSPSEIAAVFAQKLSDTNPRFDTARFIKACGVK